MATRRGNAVLKKLTMSWLGLPLAAIAVQISPLQAQFSPVPLGQVPPSAMPSQPPAPPPAAIPDDVRLNIMARNAVIALNQANVTGNYSVLRDMGTPNFQMSNSSARLAEIFAALRTKKLDLSPIFFFNPKFASQPTIQDGQIIRLAGYFPTSPEIVNFDLAFQLIGEQWMLAGIAVNIAPPTEAQASAVSSQSSSMTAENPAKPSGSQPVRIDLSKPGAANGTPPKKAAAKKPKPQPQHTAEAQPVATDPAPKTETSGNAAPKDESGASSWNPFAR